MKIITIDKPLFKNIPVLVDDNLRPIVPVYRFILYLLQKGSEKNTVLTYCKALKPFYEWLKIKGMDYHQMIEDPTKIMHNFSEYSLWLKYPTYDENSKLLPIEGHEQARDPNTINMYISILTNFYDFLAIDEGLEKYNFYKERRMTKSFHSFLSQMTIKREKTKQGLFHQKTKKKAIEYITRKQYHQLRDAANNKRDKLIMAFMFECGFRVSEICGLQIEDLRDFRDKVVYVEEREDHTNPDAACKCHSEGKEYFPDYMVDEIADFLSTEVLGVDTRYVFFNMYSTNKHSPIRKNNIEYMIRNLGKKVGIEGLHPHMFRHGVATDMLEQGCDMVQIQDKLRHKSISTTKDIYSHSTSAIKKQAQDDYEQSIRKAYEGKDIDIDDLASFLSGGEDDEL